MKKRIAAFLSALIAFVLCFAGAAVFRTETGRASAAESSVRNKIYRRIEGVNTRGPALAVLPVDSLELTISVDVPNNRFAYLGLNNSPNGIGAPAAGATAGIGILLYNSNGVSMAFEVYRNDNWAQLTETLVNSAIRPGETITVAVKKVNGARGIYINGELLTGSAKGQGGTTAGENINPLDYIDENDYSSDGKTYVEWGLWDGGGSATIYSQSVSGTLSVVDRDGEPVRGCRIDAAFDEFGNEIPLIDSSVSGEEFSLSSLVGNLIRTLKVTTAGGVTQKAKIGEINTLVGTDYRVLVTGAGEPLDGVRFTLYKGEENITGYVKITKDGGEYLLEDCAEELSVTVSRAGFTDKTAVIPAGSVRTTEIELDEKPISLSFTLINEGTARPLSGMADKIAVYKDGNRIDAAVFESSTGVYGISGFSGKIGKCEVRFENASGYVEASAEIDESFDGIPFRLYTSSSFTATVITEEGASVKAGGEAFTAAGTAYQMKNVVGEIVAEVSKAGKATRYVYLNAKNKTAQIALSDAFDCVLELPVPDGTAVFWTIDGYAEGKGQVADSRVVIPSVGIGTELVLAVDGFRLARDRYTLTEKTLSPELIDVRTTEISFLYKGKPAAGVIADFGFGSFTTDEEGKIFLASYISTTFRLISVEGFLQFDKAEIPSDASQAVVNVSGKLFRARIEVKNQAGESVSDAFVELRSGEEIKKTYLNGEIYEASGLMKEYVVFVNGVEAGRVNEDNTSLTYVLPAEKQAETPANGCNGSMSGMTALLFAGTFLLYGIIIGKIRARRG